MNELTIMNFNGIETIDSRQVAEAVGKEHKHLLRDIAKYCEYLGESKIGLTDFFIESTYTTEQNKVMPCYLLTRKGCEMVANKMTGQKGTVFTALYVNAFHAMENHIKSGAVSKDKAIKDMNAQARAKNAQTKQEKLLMDYYKGMNLSPESYQLLGAAAYKRMTGEEWPLALPRTEKTYSATEVGEMFGVSANKIGRVANANGLKTDEYGMTVLDTAPNGKQIPTFRYNQNGIDKLKELLKS